MLNYSDYFTSYVIDISENILYNDFWYFKLLWYLSYFLINLSEKKKLKICFSLKWPQPVLSPYGFILNVYQFVTVS